MKSFLIKVFLFSAVFITVVIIISTWITYRLSNNSYYRLDKSVKRIFLGHSHAKAAYSDTIIRNSRNFGQSGESYFYTYQKLQKLLSANPGIQQVFIEFTNNNLDGEMDQWTIESSYLKFHLKKYGHLIIPREKIFLFKKNPVAYMEAVPVNLKFFIDYFRTGADFYYTYADWGSFRASKESKIDSLRSVWSSRKTDYAGASKQLKPSAVHLQTRYNLVFLDSIINYCKNRSVKIVLIRAPQHPEYAGNINDSLFHTVRTKLYPTVPFLDFANFPLTEDCFLDFQHVNQKGSNSLSVILDSLLTQQYPLSF